MDTVNILLNGAKGRMGQAILEAAASHQAKIVHTIDAGDPIPAMKGVDAVIDFSVHNATPAIARVAAEAGKALVIGTTGHTEAEREAILECTQSIPIVWAGNYSIGVNLLFYLTAKAARILGQGYDPEIVEMHHRHKVDAPSGTAERLLEVVREARQLSADQVQHGRQGLIGARPDDEIGMHALRGGDVVGDHTVLFAGDGERLELTHKASNRKIFAQGALHAARWALGQPPGLYRMEDVLGLKE